MLKKSRSDGVRIGTHAVQCHFQEQTVGIPLGFRVCAAKVFESVNDPEVPETTHMPQIHFIHHLRKNPGEAVAGKQLLIPAAQQHAHLIHFSCRQGAILPTGIENHLLQVASRIRVPDLCVGSNYGILFYDALDDSGVQARPRIPDLVFGKAFLHKRCESETDDLDSVFPMRFNESTSRCMRHLEELLPGPDCTGMSDDLRSILGRMQVQAFGKITRLRLPPRKYGAHRPPKSILKGHCRAVISSLVYSQSCFDLQNDDPRLRSRNRRGFLTKTSSQLLVTRIAGEILG